MYFFHKLSLGFSVYLQEKILSSSLPTFRNPGTLNHQSCHRRLVSWHYGERHDARVLFLSSNNISLNKVLFVLGAMGVFCMHRSFIFSVACSEITQVELIV